MPDKRNDDWYEPYRSAGEYGWKSWLLTFSAMAFIGVVGYIVWVLS